MRQNFLAEAVDDRCFLVGEFSFSLIRGGHGRAIRTKIFGGRVVFKDVIKFYYDQTNKMFGTDFEPPE